MNTSHSRRAVLIGLLTCTGANAAAQQVQEPIAGDAQGYRLTPGDRVRITVFSEPDLSGEFVIDADGTINYPLVGAVAASGRTALQFEQQLRDVLTGGYVRAPRVAVYVVAYRPYYIMGEVNSPGAYPYSSGLTLLAAVATAGGFTYRASSRRVFIKNADAAEETEVSLRDTVMIRPGDVIRVPERLF